MHSKCISNLKCVRNKDVNQDKHIGVKEFDLLLKNLEFRETLLQFGGALSLMCHLDTAWTARHRHSQGTDIQTFGDIVQAAWLRMNWNMVKKISVP